MILLNFLEIELSFFLTHNTKFHKIKKNMINNDSRPQSRPAGKTYTKNTYAKDCLHPQNNDTPQTPPNIKKFTNTDAGRPEVGLIRRHWGKANEERVEEDMTHGLLSVKSVPASDLLNPPMRSLFQDVKLQDSESIYKSNQNAPLGLSAKPLAPVDEKFKQAGFGKKTEKGESAGKTVNPRKDSKTVHEEDSAGHELYVKTHNDYYVGEQINRNYGKNWNEDHWNFVFGVETPHHNDGREVCRSLRWPAPDIGESADRFGLDRANSKVGKTKLVSKRVDAFRERTQPQLGKVHDPIKSTAGMEEAFGLMLRPDGCGAGDIIHQREPANWLLGKDRKRGLLAAVRQHLKKANYHNFNTLRSAFQFYDKNGDGQIDKNELKKACSEFNLPIDDKMLTGLMGIMTGSNGASGSDGSASNGINYVAFVNLLNWKNKMPKDLELEEMNDQIIQQIDTAVTGHKTSSSFINATVGGLETKSWQSFGVPTVRSDIPAPQIRRVSDHTNYGDELNAHGLLTPSIFTNHGVFESDFFLPRDKMTIRKLFENIGVKMDQESWERCWSEARKYQERYDSGLKKKSKDSGDLVSVECFRLVLDNITNEAV